MKKWISMLMVAAMVVTTVTPTASHASIGHGHSSASVGTEQAGAHSKMAGMDCDHHAEKTAYEKQPSKDKPCCEKNVCKCLNGNCHGGLATILKDDGVTLAVDTRTAKFAFADQYIESATIARLKRPPKA